MGYLEVCYLVSKYLRDFSNIFMLLISNSILVEDTLYVFCLFEFIEICLMTKAVI